MIIFSPSVFLSIRLYLKISTPYPVSELIKKHFKYKITSVFLWLGLWGLIVFIRSFDNDIIEEIIVEGAFIFIAILFEGYLIVSLYYMLKVAISGEPMQPADIGIELKLENTLNIDQNTNENIIQATEIQEVKSLSTKEYFAHQNLPENIIDIVDFTVRDLQPGQLAEIDYD